MKEHSNEIKNKVLEAKYSKMVIYISENLIIIKNMVKAFFTFLIYITLLIRIISNIMMVNGAMDDQMEMVCMWNKMVNCELA